MFLIGHHFGQGQNVGYVQTFTQPLGASAFSELVPLGVVSNGNQKEPVDDPLTMWQVLQGHPVDRHSKQLTTLCLPLKLLS